jgi:hypothetical protein
MRLDRTTFLWAAAAMYACHAAQQEPVPREPAPVPETPEPALPSEEPDASAEAVDAGMEASVEVVDAAVDAPPKAPLPSLAALAKICRALPADKNCGWDDRRKMCQTVLAEFDHATAARAIACYRDIESSCDPCSVRICTSGALHGVPRRTLSECETVRKAVAADGDESYGKLMYDLCEEYASGMTAKGRKRFIRCLADNVGIGVRYCLWDPSATPCTENFGGDRTPLPTF